MKITIAHAIAFFTNSSFYLFNENKKRQPQKVVSVVEAKGLEPPALWSQTRCATKLRYASSAKVIISEGWGSVNRNFARNRQVFCVARRKNFPL